MSHISIVVNPYHFRFRLRLLCVARYVVGPSDSDGSIVLVYGPPQ